MSRHFYCAVFFLTTATAFATGDNADDREARYTVFRPGQCSRSFTLYQSHATIASAFEEAEKHQYLRNTEIAIVAGDCSSAVDVSVPFRIGRIKSCQVWIRGCKGLRKGTRFVDRKQALQRVRQLKDDGDRAIIVYTMKAQE